MLEHPSFEQGSPSLSDPMHMTTFRLEEKGPQSHRREMCIVSLSKSIFWNAHPIPISAAAEESPRCVVPILSYVQLCNFDLNLDGDHDI